MKAFLLAAGLGTRLGELTRETPKCLLPIAGEPLLGHWIHSLGESGVTEILVNLHHHADQVRAYLSRFQTIHIECFHEPELLGSAGTLASAWKFVENEENFLIIYADNYARVDLNRLRRFHEEKGNPVLTVLAYKTDQPSRCGILELAQDGRVLSFEEKPKSPKSNLANAGIHAASSALREFLPSHKPADLGFHVLPKLVGKMCGYVTDEYIQDIGTPEAYSAAQRAAEANGN